MNAFGFDSVMTDDGLSQSRISSTKAGLRGMKFAVAQRRIGENGKHESFEESAEHGQNAEGTYFVASDGGFLGLGK